MPVVQSDCAHAECAQLTEIALDDFTRIRSMMTFRQDPLELASVDHIVAFALSKR